MHFSELAQFAMAFGNFREQKMYVLEFPQSCVAAIDNHLSFQMDEFRQKMGSILPRITKDAPPTSRTEFDGLNDLMEYVSTWRKEP